MKKLYIFLILALFLAPLPILAETSQVKAATPAPEAGTSSNIRSGFSLGVGWPYVGAKYFFNRDLGAELRFAVGDGINVTSLRGYWSFTRAGNFSIFTGVEGGYINFDSWNENNTLRVKGNGFEAAPFFGADYFLSRNFSMMIDFSMPIFSLNYQNVNVSDLQWVINGGLYFYPF